MPCDRLLRDTEEHLKPIRQEDQIFHQQGQAEGCGFSGAGLRLRDEIAPVRK